MRASTLLHLAQAKIKDGERSPYICDVVRDLCYKKKLNTQATAERICDHIEELLEGHFSLREWLVGNGHVEGARLDPMKTCYHGPIDSDKLQRTRIAWLDHLISHYETQGD